jgi:hypothetical protein
MLALLTFVLIAVPLTISKAFAGSDEPESV